MCVLCQREFAWRRKAGSGEGALQVSSTEVDSICHSSLHDAALLWLCAALHAPTGGGRPLSDGGAPRGTSPPLMGPRWDGAEGCSSSGSLLVAPVIAAWV